jgi:hypothetical protein
VPSLKFARFDAFLISFLQKRSVYFYCVPMLHMCFAGWLAVVLWPHSLQNGFTALIWATRNGHAECAWLLLNAGADKEIMNNVRASANHEACVFGSFSNRSMTHLTAVCLRVSHTRSARIHGSHVRS